MERERGQVHRFPEKCQGSRDCMGPVTDPTLCLRAQPLVVRSGAESEKYPAWCYSYEAGEMLVYWDEKVCQISRVDLNDCEFAHVPENPK